MAKKAKGQQHRPSKGSSSSDKKAKKTDHVLDDESPEKHPHHHKDDVSGQKSLAITLLPSTEEVPRPPFLVYNAGHVDESVAFTRWTCEQERKKRATILVGSSERMDFIATSIGQSKAPPSKYVLALYDSTQEMVVLKELQAPLTFTRNLKSQVITLIPDSEKDLLSTLSIDSTNKPDIHAELRKRRNMNVLGETFGTKKKKQTIKSQEKDKIHSDSIASTTNLIIKSGDND